MTDKSKKNAHKSSAAINKPFESLSLTDNDEKVYHYCSPETLLAIISSKRIRFGDASCMNDGDEITWGLNLLEKVKTDLIERNDIPSRIPPISKAFLDNFDKIWRTNVSVGKPFLACFSSDGDSLSQWRAYAQDGQGFSLGFRKGDMNLPAKFLRVEYDVQKQRAILINAMGALFKLHKNTQHDDVQFMSDSLLIYRNILGFKNPAFKDKREVRSVHMALKSSKIDEKPRIKVAGGRFRGDKIEPAELKYYVGKGKLHPYLDYDYNVVGIDALAEVWMGPRCKTTAEELELFLGCHDFHNVEIKTAGNKYR